jgi:L-lactate dehydrogenase (cytochrome)
VKALALGAHACTMGRTYLYGLGAAGEIGVEKALTMLTSEMTRTMQLLGAQSVSDLTPSSVTRIGFP